MSVAAGSPRGHTTGQDFVRALAVCESLLEAGERRTRWLHTVRIGQVGAALLGLSAVSILLGGNGGWFGGLAVLLVAGLAIGVPGTAQFLLVAPLREQIARDETTMVDTINVLRELMPMIAEAERWGVTQRQLIEARIRRFPIGRG